jgi:ATP-binding cassette subfamily B multidrug efflux pump
MKKVVNENQKSTLRKVLRYIRRYWGYLGASIILAAVTVALTLYLPIPTGSWEREPLTLPGSL